MMSREEKIKAFKRAFKSKKRAKERVAAIDDYVATLNEIVVHLEALGDDADPVRVNSARLIEIRVLGEEHPKRASEQLAAANPQQMIADARTLLETRKSNLLNRAENAVIRAENEPRAAWYTGGEVVALRQRYANAEADINSEPARALTELEAIPAAARRIQLHPPAYDAFMRDHAVQVARRDALLKHPQATHVKTETDLALSKLTAASDAANAGQTTDAPARLGEVVTALDEGERRAEEYRRYRVRRAPTAGLLTNQRIYSKDVEAAFNVDLAKADAHAEPPKRDYATANSELDKQMDDFRVALRGWVKSLDDEIATVQSGPAADFVEPITNDLRSTLAGAEALLVSNDFVAAVAIRTVVNRGTIRADSIAKRRAVYDTDRTAAKEKVDAIANVNQLHLVHKTLSEKLRQADLLATLDKTRFEEGSRLLAEIEAEAIEAAKERDASQAWERERDEVAALKRALEEHDAAAFLTSDLAFLGELWSDSTDLADAHDWTAARAVMAQLKAACIHTKNAADAVMVIDGVAREPIDSKDEQKYVDAAEALRKKAKLAKSADHNELVEHELDNTLYSCDEVDRLAKEEEWGTAQNTLEMAGGLLATGIRVQELHTVFLAEKAKLDARLKNLEGTLGPKTDEQLTPVSDRLNEALEKAKAREYQVALAALEAEQPLVRMLETVEKQQKEAAKRSKALKTRNLSVTRKSVRKNVLSLLGDAKKEWEADNTASRFDFKAAHQLMDRARSAMDLFDMDASFRTKTLKSPDEQRNIVRELLKNGGQKEIDDWVANLSDGVPVSMLQLLIQERFGFQMTFSKSPGLTINVKKIWELCSSLPDLHADHSPSVKEVVTLKPDEDGGWYSGSTKDVNLMGRADTVETQELQGDGVLPELEPGYEVQNKDPENFFDWTTLHEVGHAVDDRLSFMAKKGHMSEYGGWEYLTDLGAIADIVHEAKGYDREYIYKRLQAGDPPAAAEPDEYTGDWEAEKAAVDDFITHALALNAWWEQSRCDAVTIGEYIYYEAYKGRWVKYLASARSKGVSGYQFRAPGEWFAEIYAAYHSGKLGDQHPSAKWLKNL